MCAPPAQRLSHSYARPFPCLSPRNSTARVARDSCTPRPVFRPLASSAHAQKRCGARFSPENKEGCQQKHPYGCGRDHGRPCTSLINRGIFRRAGRRCNTAPPPPPPRPTALALRRVNFQPSLPLLRLHLDPTRGLRWKKWCWPGEEPDGASPTGACCRRETAGTWQHTLTCGSRISQCLLGDGADHKSWNPSRECCVHLQHTCDEQKILPDWQMAKSCRSPRHNLCVRPRRTE